MPRTRTGLFERYARWAARRPAVPLLAVLAVSGLAALGARHIRLDRRAASLLPPGAPSARAEAEARRRLGGQELFVVAVESPEPERSVELAASLAERIRRWDETEWAMSELDLSVFRRSELLFMDLAELRALVDLLELRVARLQCQARGDCSERDLRTAAEVRADDDRLRAFGGPRRSPIEAIAGDRSRLAEAHPGLEDALINEDGSVAVVVARLSRGAEDLRFCREVCRRAELLVAELEPDRIDPQRRARVVGAYLSFREGDALLADAETAGLVSLGLVTVVLLLFFRRLRVVLLVFGALVAGLLWTAGVVGALRPTLPAVAALALAFLVAPALGFAVHRCAATRAAMAEAFPLPEALARGARESLPAALTSALGTAAALLPLAWADSEGARAVGLVGPAGVVLCLLSAELVVPPLWGLFEVLRPERRPPRGAAPDRGASRWAPLGALALALGLAAGLAWRAPRLGLEGDLSRLRSPVEGAPSSVGDAVRVGRGASPVALLGSSESQMRRAGRELLGRRARGDEAIGDVLTIETFLPTEQEAKLEEVQRLARLLTPRVLGRVPRESREELEELARLAEVDEPLTFTDLPAWAQRVLQERDGTVGAVGLLYPWTSPDDLGASLALAERLEGLAPEEGRPVRLGAERFVLAEAARTAEADGRVAFAWGSLALLLVLVLSLRSLRGVSACGFSVSLGLASGLGAAALFGWRLGPYDLLALPVALWLALDGAARTAHRWKRLGGAFAESPFGGAGPAVLAAAAATAAAFAGTLVVRHEGLVTIGQLVALLSATALAASLGVVPGLLVAAWGRGKAGAP